MTAVERNYDDEEEENLRDKDPVEEARDYFPVEESKSPHY